MDKDAEILRLKEKVQKLEEDDRIGRIEKNVHKPQP
jgi:hypothetical protein